MVSIMRSAVLMMLLLSACSSTVATQSTNLTGPYLGQDPPGSVPRLFAPGVVSKQGDFEHSAAVFSPDGRELFWCTNVDHYANSSADRIQRLYTMTMIDGVWTAPEVAEFTRGIGVSISRPVFSPDGNRLYIEHPSNPTAESEHDIYVVERINGTWSEPRPVSPVVNSPASERLHTITADGSMIFSRDVTTPQEGVFISRFVNGTFTEPERLGSDFDSDAMEFAIVLAKDESYMLISSSRTGHDDELHVSYKRPDGSWSERIKAPYQAGGFLALSPDGDYLFFLGDEGIFWVDTSFVDRLRP